MPTELDRMEEWGYTPYIGKEDSLVRLNILGRYPVKVQDFWAPFITEMEARLIQTGYENPCDWTGSYKKRVISGTDIWSTHAYGLAVDLDYGGDDEDSELPTTRDFIDKNPHIHRRIHRGDPGFGVEWQILEHQVDAIEAIRTKTDKQAIRWLGWAIGDTMHFEVACHIDDLRSGLMPAEPETRYPDVPKDHMFYGDIEWLAQNEITKVPEGDNFKPDQPVTRGQMAAFLHRYYRKFDKPA